MKCVGWVIVAWHIVSCVVRVIRAYIRVTSGLVLGNLEMKLGA